MADCAPQGAPRLEFAEQFVHVLALELETAVTRVAAISTLPSIVKGIPLSEEPGLGALTLPGLFLGGDEPLCRARSACPARAGAAPVRWDYSTLWKRAAERLPRALIACGMGKDSRVGIPRR